MTLLKGPKLFNTQFLQKKNPFLAREGMTADFWVAFYSSEAPVAGHFGQFCRYLKNHQTVY